MYPYCHNQHSLYGYSTQVSNNYPDSVFYQGRVFTRRSDLMQSSTWIERGSDGRPCYVKRKPALPSIRQKLAEAFRELRQKNQPLQSSNTSIPSSPQHPPAPAPTPASQSSTNTQKSKSSHGQKPRENPQMAENTNAASQGAHPGHIPAAQAQQTLSYPAYPVFPPFMQPIVVGNQSNPVSAQGQQMSAMVPHYATPHPRMYPYVPPGSQALTVQPGSVAPTTAATFNNNPNPLSQAQQHSSSSSSQGYGLRQGTASTTPANLDDFKCKCSVCGRLRSPRYQWKHRVAPGKLPGPNICHRCRKEATDSEDEGVNSDDGRKNRSHLHRRHRSRGRTSRPRSRAQSSSRITPQAIDLDYYATQAAEESSSSSDVLEARSLRRRDRRFPQTREPSVEIVRYVNRPSARSRPKSKTRKIVFVEKSSDEQCFSGDDEEEVEVHHINHAPRSYSSRRGVPARGLLERRYSSPEKSAPYFDARSDNVNIGPQYGQIRPFSSSARHGPSDKYCCVRTTSRQHRYECDPVETGEEGRQYDLPNRHRTRSRIRGGVHSRSHSRASIDEGAESGALRPYLPPAPSPPRSRCNRSVSPAFTDTSPAGNTREKIKDHNARVRSSSRCRARPVTGEKSSEDEMTPTDDYDWYDADGMRVRVREI